MPTLLLLVMNFVNQVVVGALGATAIAAVGFGNSLVFIVLITLSAFGVSASILVARAHGGGRRDELDRVASVALLLAGSLTTVLSIPLAIWSGPLLTLTGASDTVAAAGAEYLRIAAISVVPGVLAAVLSGVLRSLNRARLPMFATIVTVLLNAVLGYALVFGVGPFPELGVAGAAWATLVCTVLKLGLLLVVTFGRLDLVTWRYPRHWFTDLEIIRPIIVLAVPLGITELIWSTGTFLYNVVAQQLGDEALAAAQIVTNLETVFIVGSLGLVSATTALVGRSIGSGDADGAVYWAAAQPVFAVQARPAAPVISEMHSTGSTASSNDQTRTGPKNSNRMIHQTDRPSEIAEPAIISTRLRL